MPALTTSTPAGVTTSSTAAGSTVCNAGAWLPLRRVLLLRTVAEGQTEAFVVLCEGGGGGGGDADPAQTAVALLRVSPLPRTRAGGVLVAVTVDIDADGSVAMSAEARLDGARAGTPHLAAASVDDARPVSRDFLKNVLDGAAKRGEFRLAARGAAQ